MKRPTLKWKLVSIHQDSLPSESRTVETPAFRRFGASVKLRRSFMNQCSSLRRAVEVINHISPGYVSSSDLMFENV